MKNLVYILIAFVLSSGTLFAWTEKGDQIKRQQKAQATAQARVAIAEKLDRDKKLAEAQRLASLNSLNPRNYQSYFVIETDDFEKYSQYTPKITSEEVVSQFPATEKFAPEKGFFSPFARITQEKLSCFVKISLCPKSPLNVKSVALLFDDGNVVNLPQEQFFEEEIDAAYSTSPLHLEITGTGKFSGTGKGTFKADQRLSALDFDGSQNLRFEGTNSQNYAVTGTLPETQVSWTQTFCIPVSEELLEKISAGKRVRVRIYHDGHKKTDRELSPVELTAFRTISKLKTILNK